MDGLGIGGGGGGEEVTNVFFHLPKLAENIKV